MGGQSGFTRRTMWNRAKGQENQSVSATLPARPRTVKPNVAIGRGLSLWHQRRRSWVPRAPAKGHHEYRQANQADPARHGRGQGGRDEGTRRDEPPESHATSSDSTTILPPSLRRVEGVEDPLPAPALVLRDQGGERVHRARHPRARHAAAERLLDRRVRREAPALGAAQRAERRRRRRRRSTHKGFRPKPCESFAFAIFATPARPVANQGKPEGQRHGNRQAPPYRSTNLSASRFRLHILFTRSCAFCTRSLRSQAHAFQEVAMAHAEFWRTGRA